MSAPLVDLEKERLNRGLSLSGMAAEIGVSRGTLQRAMGGEPVHPGSALKIAMFLGKQVTDIWPLEEGEAAA
jgi:lambda repressor-like predicted transcriptional regulator